MRTDRLLDRTPGDRQKLPIGVGAMLALLLVLLLVLRALGLWGGGGWPGRWGSGKLASRRVVQVRAALLHLLVAGRPQCPPALGRGAPGRVARLVHREEPQLRLRPWCSAAVPGAPEPSRNLRTTRFAEPTMRDGLGDGRRAARGGAHGRLATGRLRDVLNADSTGAGSIRGISTKESNDVR
jgi:hypothetical protein